MRIRTHGRFTHSDSNSRPANWPDQTRCTDLATKLVVLQDPGPLKPGTTYATTIERVFLCTTRYTSSTVKSFRGNVGAHARTGSRTRSRSQTGSPVRGR